MKLGAYIKKRGKVFLLYLISVVIFGATFALYELPLEAVAYPAIISILAAVCLIVRDFYVESKKLTELELLEKQIEELKKEIVCLEQESGQRMDYYNVWTHQIKTPIAAMHLTLQGEDSALGRKLSADLNRIEQYVDMVMTYLRLDENSTDYVIQQQDLDSIIRGAIRKFSGEFIAKKIGLKYEAVNQTVLTDEKWLSFVLEQILSNALKYTSSGSITIELEEPMTLCIRDTGIGIAGEDLPRIFDAGFTGYNGRTYKRASGIGLYLCKRICEALGHGISAESKVGEGTTIKIDLWKKELNMND